MDGSDKPNEAVMGAGVATSALLAEMIAILAGHSGDAAHTRAEIRANARRTVALMLDEPHQANMLAHAREFLALVETMLDRKA